jgi:heme-degrading monooxygenase HmoA
VTLLPFRQAKKPYEGNTMIVIVFRSRTRPGLREEYAALVERMSAVAQTMPGYISHKGFYADDGERVNIVEFEHEEGLRAWRTNVEHLTAQRRGRTEFYTEYRLQVCTLARESRFKHDETATLPETAAG